MATQALVEQHIIFVSPSAVFDVNAILANSIIQALANNSLGKALISSFRSFNTWDGTNWLNQVFYEIIVYCQPTFQATIQSNIAALQTQLPGYSIFTWGHAVTWGS